MDKDIKMNLIKGLLSGRLTKKQRRGYAELESVDKELKIQWNESGNKTIDLKIKEQIWEKVKARCIDRKKDKVLSELRWYFAVASLALLLTIGGLWVNSVRNNIEDEFIKVIAQQNQMYILPDSTKVWMEPGSSIKYAKAFNQKREVWLEGNSFFEVYKQEGSFFQVHINKAFIEVKGTCFQIQQTNAERNEITLFHGKIEFNVESTGEKIVMSPAQKVMYNPNNAQTQVENIMNINWKDGRYNFKDTPLPQLISIVNQIYQSNIILEGKFTKQSSFTGSIRYDETLDDVIEKLCFSLNLTYKKQNSKIVIYN